jgi:hypothetical protein
MDRLERIAASILIRRAIRVAGLRGRPRVRVAGKIEFVKDVGPIRRDVRVQDFSWTPESLRELAKILWASQRAQSYAMAAFRLFSKMPSAQISPDGLLGGRGYIQNIKDMRTALAQAAEVLAAFTDTVDDEINAPHWQTANVGPAEEIVDQAQEVKADPTGFVEEEFQEENPAEEFDQPLENPNAEEMNPSIETDTTTNNDDDGWGEEDNSGGDGQMQTAASYAETAKKDKKILERKKQSEEPGEEGSKLPGGSGEQGEGMSIPEQTMHTTTPDSGNLASGYAAAIHKLMHAYELRTASTRVADSSVDPDSLTGPRIKHIGPGEQGFNDDEQYGSDDPTGEDLDSGVNVSKPLYEDWCADGTTGYGSPYGESVDVIDSVASRVAAAPQTYSWLPGADNSKNLDYYALGMTEQDLKWLRENSQPDPPPGLNPKKPKLDIPDLWESPF